MHTIKIAIICSFALLTAACNTRTVSRTGPSGVAKPRADEAATPIGPLPTRTVAPKVSVSTDGALALAVPPIPVAFETTGKVLAVNVQPGQKVSKGMILATLDDTTLRDALAQAKESLTLQLAQAKQAATGPKQSDIDSAQAAFNSAQARYAEIARGATATDLQQAQSALAAAQARYDDVVRGASTNDLQQAQAALAAAEARLAQVNNGATDSEKEQALRSWNQAKHSLWQSQITRDANCARDKNGATCLSNQASVGSAFESERSAYDRYQATLKPSSIDKIKSAEAEVASAKSRLATLQAQNGKDKVAQAAADLAAARSRLNTLQGQNSPEKLVQANADVAAAQARLQQAKQGQTDEAKAVSDAQIAQSRSNVDRAERNLDKAKLPSPCDCTVQDVNIAVGSSASGAAMTLLETKSMVFKTNNLSERDLAALKVGTLAQVRLKPFETSFTGKVSAILPQSTALQGNTAVFTVLITLDPSSEDLLPGMTGTAELAVK